MRKLTEQENFWKGNFGDVYISRNKDSAIISSNIALFSKVLKNIIPDNDGRGLNSIIEFGCNVGLNLIALHSILPTAEIYGVEINKQAFEQLKKIDYICAYNQSFYDFQPEKLCDLALSKGVLIHQAPEMLERAYDVLYKSTLRYILIAEYYNPTPVEVEYHGNKSVLFKRDFAGEMLDKYPDLVLMDYGFTYHRDYLFPQDDLTWFLLKKRSN
jgi:spore coat polysaccharide biosynthesis protein SpsF